MINIPINQIKEKISAKTGMSDAEITAKIKEKLRQLSGLISEEGAAHIIANELGVKLFEAGETLQIKGVLGGMRNVDLACKVVQKYEMREFTSAKGPGKVLSILVGDESGLIRIVFWNKQAENALALKEGDVIKVVGGYVRENQGRNEIHINDMAKLIVNPPGVTINAPARGGSSGPRDYTRKKISELQETDMNVEVLATIVQVFDLNFFEVCPQCNKRIRLREEGFVCQTHGSVEPDFNFVMNVYLDDGTDNVRTVLWRDQAEQLLGMKKDQILMFKDDPARFEPIKHDLLGNMIIVSGRATKNQTFDRIELTAAQVNKNPNPHQETARVKEEASKAPPKHNPVHQNVAAKIPLASTMPPPTYTKTKPNFEKKTSNPDDDFTAMNIEEELVDLDDL
jgi:hypothetical protein